MVRPAAVDDLSALDRAVAGAAIVVNCAGPFAVTGGPVVQAALRAGIPYLDVAAEIEANVSMFADHAEAARQTGTHVLPAMAFFGGLGDLLVTAAMGDWTAADEAHVAYGLSSWHPTAGTRVAGQVSHRASRGPSRAVHRGRAGVPRRPGIQSRTGSFPEPLGRRAVIAEFTMADVVTVPSHLAIPEVRTYMAVEAARDLAGEDTPAPEPVDALGRSDQTFIVDVVVRTGGFERRATARGQDIYAVTAPLVVEAVRANPGRAHPDSGRGLGRRHVRRRGLPPGAHAVRVSRPSAGRLAHCRNGGHLHECAGDAECGDQ